MQCLQSMSNHATLCDKVCQWRAADQWFSPGTPVSSTNKTERHDITEILLKIAFNTTTPPPSRHPKKHVTPYVCILSFENQKLKESVIKQVLFSSWLFFCRKIGFYMKSYLFSWLFIQYMYCHINCIPSVRVDCMTDWRPDDVTW